MYNMDYGMYYECRCFSCHNGNLLHFDQGSEYSSKFPRNKDRVGLLVDMRTRTLEVTLPPSMLLCVRVCVRVRACACTRLRLKS